MVSKTVILKNKAGLHLRPAHGFVKAMERYPAEITICYDGKAVNGKSILQLMTACIPYGSRLTVICSGEEEETALHTAAALLQNDGEGAALC